MTENRNNSDPTNHQVNTTFSTGQADTLNVRVPRSCAARFAPLQTRTTADIADDPRLATLSLLVTARFAARDVTVSSTLDAPLSRAVQATQALSTVNGFDTQRRLLEDTQAYLLSRVRRVAPGDSLLRAWDTFYGRYDSFVRRVAQACGVRRADLDDCRQEIWLEVIRKLPLLGYDHKRGRLCCWLFTLSRRKTISFLRRQGRKPPRSIFDLEHPLCGRDLCPAETYERRRRRRIVRHVLFALRPRLSAIDNRLLHLRWTEDHSVEEVASRLGLTSKQIRRRHDRIKPKVRQLLEVHGEDGAGVA